MTTARLDWSTCARGTNIATVALIEGVPAVLVSEGHGSVTTVAVTAPGTLDTDFWPGLGATLAAYAKPWLRWGWDIEEAIEDPTTVRNASMTLTLSDPFDATGPNAATVLFARGRSLRHTRLTAAMTAAQLTVPVEATAGWPIPGFLYLQRETIAVNGTGGGAFIVPAGGRGKFGSQARRHAYSLSPAPCVPTVYDGVHSLSGRRCTVWLATLDADGVTIRDPSLVFDGHVAPGSPVIASAAWTLTLNGALGAISGDIVVPKPRIGGIAHRRGSGRGSGGYVVPENPLSASVTSAGFSTSVTMLDDPTVAADSYGWHPSAEAFLLAFQGAADTGFAGTTETMRFTRRTDGKLRVDLNSTAGAGASGDFRVAWDRTDVHSIAVAAPGGTSGTSESAFPEAFVPLSGWITLDAVDALRIPAIPVPGVPAGTEASYVLVPPETSDGDYVELAPVEGGVQSLIITALSAGPVALTYRATVLPLVPAADAANPPVTVLLKPLAFTLGVWAHHTQWWTALQAAAVAMSELDVDVDTRSIDWTRIAEVIGTARPTIPTGREYVLTKSIGKTLQNEAALMGASVVPYRGRVAIARLMQLAITEPVVLTITTNDLAANEPDPSLETAPLGVVTTYKAELSPTHTVTVIDADAAATYGTPANGGSEIVCRVPPGVLPERTDDPALLGRIYMQGQRALAVWRRPYDIVRVTLPLTAAGVSVGDAVHLSEWLLPNGDGTRGLQNRVGLIVRKHTVADSPRGVVELSLRLGETEIAGYAPAAFVAAGGIAGANVTLDTTTNGAAGFSPTSTDTDGGASKFRAGDVARLYELDNVTPLANAAFTVLSVAGPVVTLTAAPGAAWVALAAAAVKVMIRAGNYAEATNTAAGLAQHDYCYLADRATLLLGGADSAREYAA